MVIGTLIGTYWFPILADPRPLYGAAAVLLACNLAYLAAAGRGESRQATRAAVTLAMVQMEVDLVVLTAVLHFSGDVANPFLLFYVFHVIIATIILPRNLSFVVGLTAIALFGLLTMNELNAGTILGHYPLQLSVGGGMWRNPVYGLAAFVAFACTVMIAQYLTHIILDPHDLQGAGSRSQQPSAPSHHQCHVGGAHLHDGRRTDGAVQSCGRTLAARAGPDRTRSRTALSRTLWWNTSGI